jgi:hypothetical protein
MQKDDLRSSLNLRHCRVHWFLKLQSQIEGLGSRLWKTLSFLSFHNSQDAIRLASKKHGLLCITWPLISLLESSIFSSQSKPIFYQHSLAKGQLKNKCSIVSSSPVLHIIQTYPPCTLRFLLCSMVFVFNLSTKISQAKNLILGVHLDFQIFL